MRIAIMGAGAVGCYYGAMLARAGHDVVLIGRQKLVDAVAANGLVLEMTGNRYVTQVEAATAPAAIAGAEMVLFCVKSLDTESAGTEIAPYLGPETLLLSLQNGISNPDRLSEVTGHLVIPAVVYVASAMAGPGVVRHEGRGDLLIGGAGAERAGAVLNEAGIETAVSDAVVTAQWNKLVLNCGYNALSALSDLPYGRLVEGRGIPELIADVVAECRLVAEACGVTLDADLMQVVRSIPEVMPGQKSSTAQDLARGKLTEIDFLNGEILRLGQDHGIATPINRVLTVLVRLLQETAEPPAT